MKIRTIYYLFALVCSMSVFMSCTDDKSADANIIGFSFEGDVIKQIPVINQETGEITFIVLDGTDISALTPIVLVSKNATVNPATGVAQDFANPVKYTVTAEDGSIKVYTVSCLGSTISYDFEEWVDGIEDEDGELEAMYYEVANGWSSSNTGAAFLRLIGFTDKYVVNPSSDAKTGSKAAKIETIDSKGADMGFVKVPKVTSGSLFMGKFETNIDNTLLSTKFGNEFSRKPLSFKGFYKYTPGPVYYRCESPATCHVAIEDPKTVDECSINAVLYEVSTFDDPKFSEYLTGVDVNTSDKLVAVATLKDGKAKAEYTPFEIEFTYLKPFDATKKYRFAIICSSSKDGDKFNGAPGSVLIVDSFELTVE